MAKKTAEKAEISFGTWVKTVARARGEVGFLVRALRDEKGLTEKTPLKSAQAKFGGKDGFDDLVKRYNLFVKRGSQAGMRSRAAA